MRSFINIASVLVLLIMAAACAKMTVDAIDKTQAQRERAELVRCQEGYTAACQKWQQVQAHYQQPTIGALGGHQ